MFKSKIDFNAFDKNNKKVKGLDATKVKGSAKAGTKKLAKGKDGDKTVYHLILDYFQDDKGKGVGHFFDFGLNKKLSKHFEQVELKSGKVDKSMSESPKKACTGEAYIKEINGKKVVHIEPSEKSKVPKGQWPKILKSMKAFFGGLKAVVVIAGEVVEEIKDTVDGEEASQPSGDAGSQPEDKPTDNKSVISLVKSLFKEISGSLKNEIPQVVLPNIKSKKVSQDDLDATSSLLEKFQQLKGVYEEASDDIKAKISKHYDALTKQLPKIKKLQDAVEKLLGISGDEEDADSDGDSEEAKSLKEFLKYVEGEIGSFDTNFSKLEEELKNAASEVIASGDDLLKELF
jgi:hypothetical protein